MRLLKGKGSEEDDRLFAPVLEMAEELNNSQILIVSAPMWNFSFPYVVKQYIDIALQPGIKQSSISKPFFFTFSMIKHSTSKPSIVFKVQKLKQKYFLSIKLIEKHFLVFATWSYSREVLDLTDSYLFD